MPAAHRSAPPPAVPRVGRLLDLAGIALVAAGAIAYGRAYVGLQALEGLTGASASAGAAMAEFDRLWRLSRVGMAVFGLGVVVACAAAVVARMRASAPPSP